MTIEEKRHKIKEHCKTKENCSYCSLCRIDKNCWHIANNGSDKEAEEIYNILTYGKADVTRNIAEVSDIFICDKCGVHYEHKIKFKFKYCPECGRWIVEE